jgi:c-di-GMP-binding flagellar brake protein YcgR
MQPDSKLTIGQRVEVRFDGLWLPTRLEGLLADRLEIAWPTDRERRLLPLKPGDTLQIVTSAQDALYSATTKVEGVRREGLPLLTLHIAGEWARSQRRGAVRVPVAIRPRVAAKIEGELTHPLRAGISNLSANGVQLRCQDELKPGDLLDLAFAVMDMDEEVQAVVRVRRVQVKEHGALKVWEAGCQFEDLPQRVSQKLVQFIFAQQRAMARSRKAS